MIDLFYPYIPKEVPDAVADVLKTRWIGQGPKVKQFEKDFCGLFQVSNAVSVNSGTAALETAYDLIGLKEGDEVITTPLTCTATNLPLLARKVKIVWADILADTLCIDYKDVCRKVTNKTKAIVQVHLGGIRADLSDHFDQHWHNPVIVSDAAQALGIFTGHYTCCSFQAIKHISTCDGGMVVCPDQATAYKAKLMRWFGIDRDKRIENNWQAYTKRKMTQDIEILGYKRQMHDVAATMGIIGLQHYREVIEYRKKLFNLYKDLLSGVDGITVVDGDVNTYWLLTVLVERREDFAKMLFSSDIDSNTVHVRNDIFDIFGGKRQELPVMNEVEEKYISLPLGMHVSEEDVQYICEKIKGGW